MRHLYKLLTLIVLIPFFSAAQTNYKSGYIISLSGDTVKGYINYREWERNPRKVLFNNATTGGDTTYDITNCNGFGINGYEYYRKFVLPVSMDKAQVTALSTGLDTSSVTDTIFLKLVTQGVKLTLYKFSDDVKQRFYVGENSSKPFELINHLYFDSEESTKVIAVATYKQQLQRLAFTYQPNDDKLKEKINNSPYEIKDIQQIINEINGPGGYTQTLTQSGGGTRFFAGISGINNQTKFSGETTFAGQSHSSSFPGIDLGLDVLANKSIGTLIFRLELGFTGNKAQFTNVTTENFDQVHNSKLTFNQLIAYFNPQIVYNFYNTSNLKVYAAVGAIVNYSAYSDKNYTSIITFGGTSSPTYPDFPDLNSVYFSGSAKVGIVFNENWDVFAGYNPATSLNDNIGYNVKVSQTEIGIKYLFDIK